MADECHQIFLHITYLHSIFPKPAPSRRQMLSVLSISPASLLLQPMPMLPFLPSRGARGMHTELHQKGLDFHLISVLFIKQRHGHTSVGRKRPLQEILISSNTRTHHSKHPRFPCLYVQPGLLPRPRDAHSTGFTSFSLEVSKSTLLPISFTKQVKTLGSSKLLNLGESY